VNASGECNVSESPATGTRGVMAPKLKLSKGPAANVRRLATKHIDGALESVDLILARADPEAVHDLRTRCKRLRAIVRLARPAMRSAYRHENTAFRDLARELGDARDAQVLVETFDDLLTWAAPEADGRSYVAVRAILGQCALEATKELQETADEQGQRVRRGFLDARQRVADWPIDGLDSKDVVDGVQRNYRQGRKALRDAATSRTAEAFHEWRKLAKYSWYHVQILRPIAQNVLQPTTDAYHELSSLLGSHHDLVVFADTIRARPDGIDERSIDELEALAARRRHELEDKALGLAEPLYAEKPKRFGRHLAALWNVSS
jgi:CHAD domain-containing protein